MLALRQRLAVSERPDGHSFGREMIEIRDPGLLAHVIEVELARYRHARGVFTLPLSLAELAEALERVAALLRLAESREQAVDLGDDVMRLIQQFRGALRTIGGAPAEA
jgi:hypothetical protein